MRKSGILLAGLVLVYAAGSAHAVMANDANMKDLAVGNSGPFPIAELSRATCDTGTPVAVPSLTPFSTLGAGPHGSDGCGLFTDATQEGIWFSVVGTGNQMTASTCNQADYDTMLAVTCAGCAAQTCVATNDDGAGCAAFSSEVTWDSQAGVIYNILLTGFNGASGTGDLTITDGGANQGQPVECRTTGACCVADACGQRTEDDCDALGGDYLGDGSECSSPGGGVFDYVVTPDLPIPDNSPAGISDTIEVTESFLIADLNVDFITDHTWIGDLIITIEGPNGPTITLWNRNCNFDQFIGIDTEFDDEGTAGFCDSPTPDPNDGNGNVIPLGGTPLSVFDGTNAQGTWTITVSDNFAADTGILQQWSLHFEDAVSNCSGACCTDEPGVASDCIETSPQECEADNGLFVGGSCADIVDCLPLFVEFDDISATKVRDGVLIEWTTSTEIDTVGFRVLREEGARTKTISTVGNLPAAGNGLLGGSYMILDREGNMNARYWLEDIDVGGRVTRHGPFKVVPGVREQPEQGRRIGR